MDLTGFKNLLNPCKKNVMDAFNYMKKIMDFAPFIAEYVIKLTAFQYG